MSSDLEEVWGWLQTWWSRAGDIVANYDLSPPADPWAWDGWVSAGVFRIPSAVAGVETAPFVELLKAIVSLWEPGPEIGPRRTKAELWSLSSAAWTAYNRLQALKTAAAELESEDSPTEAAEAATQPAGPAIVEAPQPSPQGASGPQPGSTPSDSAAGAAAPQRASGPVEWSNYRKPADWRVLLEKAKARFTSKRGWSKERAKDPAAFDGTATWVRISKAKALELGLRLPEFETEAK